MAVYNAFNSGHDKPMEIPLPLDRHFRISDIYSDAEAEVTVTDGRLICAIPEDMRAVAVLLAE